MYNQTNNTNIKRKSMNNVKKLKMKGNNMTEVNMNKSEDLKDYYIGCSLTVLTAFFKLMS